MINVITNDIAIEFIIILLLKLDLKRRKPRPETTTSPKTPIIRSRKMELNDFVLDDFEYFER